MKNKKIKKYILVLIVILLCILYSLVVYIRNRLLINEDFYDDEYPVTEEEFFENNEEPAIEVKEENYEEEDYDEELLEIDQESSVEEFYTETPRKIGEESIYFYTVKEILQNFMIDLTDMSIATDDNANSENVSDNDLRKKAYDRLSKEFIEKNSIGIENIAKKLYMEEFNTNIQIQNMTQFFVKENNVIRFSARLCINEDDSIRFYNFIVYLDYKNMSYAIEPIDRNIKDITTVKLDSAINEIEKNKNNLYKYVDRQ